MSSGLPGLVKYRYQKKEAERLNSAACHSKQRTAGQAYPTSPCPKTNPGSPVLQPSPHHPINQTAGSGSPVIQKSRTVVQGVQPAKQASPVNAHTNMSCNANIIVKVCSPIKQQINCVPACKVSPQSPVLGIGKCVPCNGYAGKPNSSSPAKSSSSSPLLSSRQSTPMLSPKSRSTVTPEEREMLINISGLRSMFPDKHRDEIEHALKEAQNNFDVAVDYLIDNKFAEFTIRAKKRKLSPELTDLSSPDSSPIAPASKRIRRISSDDSFAESTPSTSASPTKTHAQIVMEKVKSLQSEFPSLPREVIASALCENAFDVDEARQALEKMSNEEVSQTENVGSIKAMKKARALALARGKIAPTQDEAEPAKVSRIKRNTKSRHAADMSDAGSGEEWNDDCYSSGDEQPYLYQGQEGVILKFFNEATLSDLLCISGCSKKKAGCIMEMRPFNSWNQMVEQFEENRSLSSQLLEGCKEVLRVREVVQKLINRCERISRDIETVVNKLTGRVSLDDSSDDYIRQQPSLLNPEMQLTQYQLVGLNWLVVMHEQELNGILGDDMGLGKTIQTIAFLAYMKEHGEEGPHLVIAPSSTLDNWLRELKTWCPSLKVLMYYGSQKERTMMRHQIISGSYEDFDVAITTYNMATGSVEDRSLFKKFNWNYAIFDEGHMLKNMSSVRYKTLTKIRADRRLLLTGTPLQNNLLELMSLLAFVMPDIFTSKTEHLKKIFNSMSGKSTNEERSSYEMENIEHAKQILKPFFLRRLKVDVLQQLPKKRDIIKLIELSSEQRKLYDSLKKNFTDMLKDESVVNQSGVTIMMQLRKVANHHLLHRYNYDVAKLRKMAKAILKEPTHYEAGEQYVFEDMEVMSDFELHQLCTQYKEKETPSEQLPLQMFPWSPYQQRKNMKKAWTTKTLHQYQLDEELIMNSGKFRFLDELLPSAEKDGSRVLLFSQFTMMLDIIGFYMNKRGYKFLRLDGSTPVAERQEMIDVFNTDSSVLVFLLSTKAGGLGINLTAADVVVIHDIDFNPYNDKQAEDRCHRLGQKKEVKVYRLIANNTIEDVMMKCAQGKLQLEQDVTGSKQDSRFDKVDVAALLRDALRADC